MAGRSPRVATASMKLFAIVSATVSTAALAMLAPSVLSISLRPPALTASLFFRNRTRVSRQVVFSAKSFLTPRFLLLPAPLAARASFLGAEIKFLDVLGGHQPLAAVVHDDAADFQNVTIMRGFQRHLGVLLDQQDRHALFFVNAPDDGKYLLHQDRRQAERRLVEQQQRRP